MENYVATFRVKLGLRDKNRVHLGAKSQGVRRITQTIGIVYDHVKQQLCLYYGPAREWIPDKMIADTIVPWASEWLLHYEFWLVTGIWHGGGIHPR